jgi:hypothetical protein
VKHSIFSRGMGRPFCSLLSFVEQIGVPLPAAPWILAVGVVSLGFEAVGNIVEGYRRVLLANRHYS